MMTRSKTRAAARKMDPDYDCLEKNPRCPCGLLLNEDDMAVWEEDESNTPMCEACFDEMEDESDEESDDESDDKSDDESDDKSDEDAASCELCGNNCDEKIIGCCNDGNCPRNIENMCQNCGTWYEKEEVWRCSDCVAAKCDAPPHASKKIPRNIWKEMEKVLKDGLNTYHGSIYDQAEYKDLCLGIVLDLLKNECEFCD